MSNLPPGVTDNMIPGNRPEDVLAEGVADALAEALASYGASYESLTDDELEAFDRLVDDALELILTVSSRLRG